MTPDSLSDRPSLTEEDYLARAVEAERCAREASTLWTREAFLKLAKGWRNAAERAATRAAERK